MTDTPAINRKLLVGKALRAAELPNCCDAEQFAFATTDDLAPLGEIIGQDRALAAIRFGLDMASEGYNLYVLGPPGSGKFTATRQYLTTKASTEPVPSDWCYVNNFADSAKPQLLTLPAGRGGHLRRQMQHLVEELQTVVPAAFDSDSYKARARALEEEMEKRQQAAFRELQEAAAAESVRMQQTDKELSFVPLQGGEELTPQTFNQLPKEEQHRLEAVVDSLRERLRKIIQLQLPQWQKEARERFRKLNQEVIQEAVAVPFAAIQREFADLPSVLLYLHEVHKDIIANARDLRPPEHSTEPAPGGAAGRDPLVRFQVNLLLDRAGDRGAPIVYEPNPSYVNLMGRIEHSAYMGALLTDFTLIKPGALHRANGGYLMLDANKVLTQPFAWDALKQALCARELRIAALEQSLSLISTSSLEPQPIPLDIKVVLLGDRQLYYLLYRLDPDFAELFKVAADFEAGLERTPANDLLYARMIATVVGQKNLLPFDRAAVAAVIQRSMRLEADSTKLSTHMRSIADLLVEADHWARAAGRTLVSDDDIFHAVAQQTHRLDRVRDQIQESIQRHTLLIDTTGAVVGQVNGLSVLQLGNFSFGQPSRITCTTRLGDGRVIDIERETTMGGPSHSKGVFILSSFLGARYGQHSVLSLTASLAFEQSYGGVDGDSASLAELCALLSSISQIPIRQCFAMTGSINQFGQVQVIGGINEKVEGFFDVCRARGLTGDQGVLLPRNNVQNLLLRRDVVAAIAAGEFSLYPVSHVDEAIEILTGMRAGRPNAKGGYAATTVNGRVQTRLQQFAELRSAFGKGKAGTGAKTRAAPVNKTPAKKIPAKKIPAKKRARSGAT